MIKRRRRSLTVKQENFCNAYISNGGVVYKAYLEAYDADIGTQKASVRGCHLLADPKVQAHLDKMRRAMGADAMIDAVKVLDEAYTIAMADPKDLFDEHGNVKEIKDWPEGLSRAVSSVKVTQTAGKKTIEVKLWDKNSALEKLFRNCGLYAKDKVIHANVRHSHDHHHLHESVRDTEKWVEDMFEGGEERPAEIPRPN